MAVSNARTFMRLIVFLRPYRSSLIVSTILAVLSQAAAIAVIVLTGFVINELRGGQDGHYLAFLILAILAVGLLRAILMLGRRFISGKQAIAVEWDMRDALYARLLRLSFGYFDRHQTGQLMSRATVDLQTIRFFLGYGLIFFAQHVITILCVTTVLFFYDWQLALIALAITPLLVGVAYRYSHVSHPVLRDVQQQLADVATVAEESIVGIHVVKSFAQEDQVEQRFRDASDSVFARERPREHAAGALRAAAHVPADARPGRRPARGRALRRPGRPHDRRLLRLQPPPDDARDAAAHARHVGRPGPARDRLGRAVLRGDRRAGGGGRRPRRRRAGRRARAASPSRGSASATTRSGRC